MTGAKKNRMPTKAERLEQIHAILTNRRHPIRSIADVAAEHGFDNLAEFNKAFYERFGKSAVVVREFARNPGGRGRKR